MLLSTLSTVSLWACVHAVQTVQVTYPIQNYGSPVVSLDLFDVTAGNSFGKNFTVNYVPPEQPFNKVTLSLEFDTSGKQFDRLGHLYLQGVEIWRPSTPEPGERNVTSTFTKDVSHFAALFAVPGELLFQLDNFVDATYTGPINAKIRAKFFAPTQEEEVAENDWFSPTSPASKVQALGPLLMSLPVDHEVKVSKVTANTTRAGVYLTASGDHDEEFWWANSQASGPTRMVYIAINGNLAGFAQPFPVLYTGGVNPEFWSPLMGIHTSDVPSYYVDVTPFLPELWQADFVVKFHVGNGIDEAAIGNQWLVNAALFTWEVDGIVGSGHRYPSKWIGAPMTIESTQGLTAVENSMLQTTAELSIGINVTVEWTQFSKQTVIQTNEANKSLVVASILGNSSLISTSKVSDDVWAWKRSHAYPLAFVDVDHQATILQGYSVDVLTPFGGVYVNSFSNSTAGSSEISANRCTEAITGTTAFKAGKVAVNGTIVSNNATCRPRFAHEVAEISDSFVAVNLDKAMQLLNGLTGNLWERGGSPAAKVGNHFAGRPLKVT